jgi:ABC-type branched-subunit amino acid transport system substrate-binding protein
MAKNAITQLLVSLFLFITSPILFASEPIKVGMSAMLTGPSAAIGNDLRSGIESYFKLVNDAGGVQDRRLELLVRDDGYEPERAAFNMRQLINEDGVLAVLGNVGTPTAIVTVPIAESTHTLLLGAFSGGDVLRSHPVSRYVINYRPSYAEETTEIINGLLQIGIEPNQIAFFTQRDGFGDAAYRGAIDALQQHGFNRGNTLIHGRYTRNTLNVEDAVVEVLEASVKPKVVMMAGGYAPSAKFIKLVQAELPNLWFVNVSFVGSHSLKLALGDNSNHVVVTRVVPDLDSSLPIVEEFNSALEKFNSSLSANEVSLEGFIIAKIFHQGLLNISGEINKESIIDGIEAIKEKDLGLGFDIYLDGNEHQAIHKLWLKHLENGKFKSFDWKNMLQVKDSKTGNE